MTEIAILSPSNQHWLTEVTAERITCIVETARLINQAQDEVNNTRFAFECRRSCADAGKSSRRAKYGIDSPPQKIQNSMLNAGLKGDLGVRNRGKIGKAAIAVASTFGLYARQITASQRPLSSTVALLHKSGEGFIS